MSAIEVLDRPQPATPTLRARGGEWVRWEIPVPADHDCRPPLTSSYRTSRTTVIINASIGVLALNSVWRCPCGLAWRAARSYGSELDPNQWVRDEQADGPRRELARLPGWRWWRKGWLPTNRELVA